MPGVSPTFSRHCDTASQRAAPHTTAHPSLALALALPALLPAPLEVAAESDSESDGAKVSSADGCTRSRALMVTAEEVGEEEEGVEAEEGGGCEAESKDWRRSAERSAELEACIDGAASHRPLSTGTAHHKCT